MFPFYFLLRSLWMQCQVLSAHLNCTSSRWYMASSWLTAVRDGFRQRPGWAHDPGSCGPLSAVVHVIDSSRDIDSLCLEGKWEFDMTYCVSQQDS